MQQMRLLDLMRTSGDASPGQMLIRLARLAAAADRHQFASHVLDASIPSLPKTEGQDRIEGFNPPLGFRSRKDAGLRSQPLPETVHTEVNR